MSQWCLVTAAAEPCVQRNTERTRRQLLTASQEPCPRRRAQVPSVRGSDMCGYVTAGGWRMHGADCAVLKVTPRVCAKTLKALQNGAWCSLCVWAPGHGNVWKPSLKTWGVGGSERFAKQAQTEENIFLYTRNGTFFPLGNKSWK